MKLNKRLRNNVNQMIKLSTNKDGTLDEKKITLFSSHLKRLPLTSAILSLTEFSKSVKRQISQTTLTIEAPISIPQLLQKKIAQQLLAHHFSPITKTILILNPSLLGGVRIKIGDTLIDNSLKDKLNQLTDRIIN